jgi:Na+-transporting methylmalonyl-CoA/oxaloacetate decarboxylase gamma subunit
MTFKDKMKAAGTNTIIGMGIVFIVLIFISFIISLLKYVPMLFDKETREKAKAAKKAAEVSETETKADNSNVEKVEQIVDIVNTSTGESVMNDSELVAVITAAVAAASSDKPAYVNYPSNDKLIARQIRRTRR